MKIKPIRYDFANFFKSDFVKKYYIYFLLLLVALFAFYIRSTALGGPYVNGDDPHLGLRLGEYFAEHGKLPANDSLRYYPIGFDYFGDRNLWPYTEGIFIWGAQQLGYPPVRGAQFFPPFFGVLGVIALFFVVKQLFGSEKIALIASFLFASLPAALYRANSAFADKEPIVTFVIFLFLFGFFKSIKKFDYKWAIFAGLSLFVVNYGSGLATLIYITLTVFAFIMLLMNIKTREFTDTFLIISGIYSVLSFALGLEGCTSIYLLSNVGMMALVGIVRLDDKFHFVRKYFHESHSIHKKLGTYLVVGAAVLGLLVSFVYTPLGDRVFGTLKILAAPISSNPFGSTVAENRPSSIDELEGQLGADYAEIGLTTLSQDINNRLGINLNLSFLAPLYKLNLVGAFYLSIIGLVILIVQLSRKRISKEVGVFMIIFYVVMFILAKGAVRLLFTFVFPTVILASYGIFISARYLLRKSPDNMKMYSKIAIGTVLAFILSAHMLAGHGFGKQLGASMDSNWENALKWINANSTPDDTVLSWWDYGYIIQYYADRRTYVDPANQYSTRNTQVAKFFTSTNESLYLDWLTQNKIKYVVHDSSMVGKYSAVTKLSHQEDLKYPGEPVDQYQIYSSIGGSCIEKEGETCTKGVFKYSSGSQQLWLVQTEELAYPVMIQGNQPINVSKLCVADGEKIVVDPNGLDACAMFTQQYAVLMAIRCGPAEKLGQQGSEYRCIGADNSDTIFSQMWFFDAVKLNHFKKVYDNGQVKVFEFLPQGKA